MSQHAPTTSATVPAERSTQSTVCAAIAALVRERWGRGPRRGRAYWAGADALLVILDDAHTDSERTLLRCGRGAEVIAGRRLLGELAEPELRDIAESATGRRVAAVLWQSSLSPALSTLVFLLEPAARGGRADEPMGDSLRQALDRNTASARALIAEGEQARRHGAERRAERQAQRGARPPYDA